MTNEVKTLRTALSDISDLADGIYNDPSASATNSAKILEIASEALNQPLRNCDIGTPDDQDKRFRKFCEKHCDNYTCKTCPLKEHEESCEFYWLQMRCN